MKRVKTSGVSIGSLVDTNNPPGRAIGADV